MRRLTMKLLMMTVAGALIGGCNQSVWPVPMSWLAALNGVSPVGGVLVVEGDAVAQTPSDTDGVSWSLDATDAQGNETHVFVFPSSDAIDDYLQSEEGAPVLAARGRGVWAFALVSRLRPDVADDSLPVEPGETVALWMRDMKPGLSMSDLGEQTAKRKETFRTLEGLLQKLYLYDAATKTISGFYLWDSREHAKAYLDSPFAHEALSAYELEHEPTKTIYDIP